MDRRGPPSRWRGRALGRRRHARHTRSFRVRSFEQGRLRRCAASPDSPVRPSSSWCSVRARLRRRHRRSRARRLSALPRRSRAACRPRRRAAARRRSRATRNGAGSGMACRPVSRPTPGPHPMTSHTGGPASAAFVVEGHTAKDVAGVLQTALQKAGYTAIGSSQPLEDGSVVLDMTGSPDGCMLQVTVTPDGRRHLDHGPVWSRLPPGLSWVAIQAVVPMQHPSVPRRNAERRSGVYAAATVVGRSGAIKPGGGAFVAIGTAKGHRGSGVRRRIVPDPLRGHRDVGLARSLTPARIAATP